MDNNKLFKCQTNTFREDKEAHATVVGCGSFVSPTASVVNELTVTTARGKKCLLVFMPRLGEGGWGC